MDTCGTRNQYKLAAESEWVGERGKVQMWARIKEMLVPATAHALAVRACMVKLDPNRLALRQRLGLLLAQHQGIAGKSAAK